MKVSCSVSRWRLLASAEPATSSIPPKSAAMRRDYDQIASQLDAEGPRVKVIRIADVQTRVLEPLWPGVIWVGKPTLLVGDPGLSKSTLVCDVVARITQHGEWPCSGGKTIAGEALMLSAEEGVAATLVP